MQNEITKSKLDKPKAGCNTSRPVIKAAALAIVLLGLCLVVPAFSGNRPPPGNSSTFGKNVAEWQDLYWRWALGNITIAPDANGNAVVGGHVVLMPIPSTPGDGTPGSLDVTLKTGQAFVLAVFAFCGSTFVDATPVDEFLSLSIFQTLDIKVTLDGATILDGSNVMQYFSQFTDDPPIPFDFPPFNFIIWFQTVGMVHTPLSAGSHVLHLHVKNTEPGFGFIA